MFNYNTITNNEHNISVTIQGSNIRSNFSTAPSEYIRDDGNYFDYFNFEPEFTINVANISSGRPIVITAIKTYAMTSSGTVDIRENDYSSSDYITLYQNSDTNINLVDQTSILRPFVHSAGTYDIYLAITYKYNTGTIHTGTATFILGSVTFYNYIIGSRLTFNANDFKSSFYQGETITFNGVTAYKTYSFNSNVKDNNREFYREDVTSETTFTTALTTEGSSYNTYTVTATYNQTTVGTYNVYVYPSTTMNLRGETKNYVLATNVSVVTHENVSYAFGQDWSDNKLVGASYPLFPDNKVTDGEYTGSEANTDCVGYIEFGSAVSNKKARLVLFEDPENPMSKDENKHASENITVLFPNYDSKQADRINKAQFGIIYSGRLFVSGNPEYKNCDWHTQPINDADYDTTHDYTYFSDLDYCYYGGDDTAIVGYDIFRDGDLIVIKEGSRNQATLYRRTLQLTAAMSYDGNSTVQSGYVEESFPMFDINASGGEGGLSHRSITNFVGETLILTKTGLKALTTNEDIKNNAKYSKAVSTRIDPKITREDLASAVLFTYKEKLFLSTSRGTYVGYNELKDDEGYEWYFLDFKADYFFEYDDELYFGDNDSNIYRFPKDRYDADGRLIKNYTDKTRVFIESAGAIIEDGWVYTSAKYNKVIENGKEIILLATYPIFVELASAEKPGVIPVTIGGTIYKEYVYVSEYSFDPETNVLLIVNSDFNDTLYDNQEVYIYWTRDTDVVMTAQQISDWEAAHQDGKYILKQTTSTGFKSFQIFKGLTQVTLSNTISFRILDRITEDTAITIRNAQYYGNGKKFRTSIGYDSIGFLPRYVTFTTDSNDFWQGTITDNKNVSAFYETIPYSFGTLSKMKNIWSWTIANDTDLESYMDVGYLGSINQGGFKADWALETTSGSRALDFGLFTMNTVQFTSDKLPHVYVRYRTVPMVNFIRFMFKNEEDSNMVLSLLEVTYSIGEFSRGSK